MHNNSFCNTLANVYLHVMPVKTLKLLLKLENVGCVRYLVVVRTCVWYLVDRLLTRARDLRSRPKFIFIYLLCHIYLRVPHQCAALFSLGLLHYIHDNTNINQYTFSSNTVITWYMYMLTTYSYTCFSLNITMVTWSWCRFIEMLTTYSYLIHVWSTYN